MSPDEAVERLEELLAHAWMVRTFLKHAEEIEDDVEMLDVHRTIFDSIRAVEPAHQRGDVKEYLRRLKGKAPKLRRAAEFFDREYRRVTDHTNYQMAARSLTACVREIEAVLGAVKEPGGP
jgi:alkylhydroperoxidase family enzyme